MLGMSRAIFLRKRSQREHHMRRLQHFVDFDTAALYKLKNHENDLKDDGDEVSAYSAGAENQFLADEENWTGEFKPTIKSRVPKMFAVLDHTGSQPSITSALLMYNGGSTPFYNDTSLDFVPISLTQRRDIKDTLIMSFNSFPNQHLLIDPGAPRLICSEEWQKTSPLIPLKTIETAIHTPMFHFARHSVCALYAVKIAAKTNDIQGLLRVLKLFVYVHPLTSIPFLLSLTDKSLLGFDVCLREKNFGHLQTIFIEALFLLMITFHVGLCFKPLRLCSAKTAEWNLIVFSYTLDTASVLTQALILKNLVTKNKFTQFRHLHRTSLTPEKLGTKDQLARAV